MPRKSEESGKSAAPIDRRTVLGGSAALGGLIAAQPAKAAPTKVVLPGANTRNFTVAIVGEAMV
jgi:hypothetical protein